MNDAMSNSPPETGAFAARDRLWHPPAFTPGYKTSVLRSPQKAPISFDNTISEITGPAFGHGIIGELDNDLIHNFARPGESAIGQRVIVHGRVLDERVAPDHALVAPVGGPDRERREERGGARDDLVTALRCRGSALDATDAMPRPRAPSRTRRAGGARRRALGRRRLA